MEYSKHELEKLLIFHRNMAITNGAPDAHRYYGLQIDSLYTECPVRRWEMPERVVQLQRLLNGKYAVSRWNSKDGDYIICYDVNYQEAEDNFNAAIGIF
jgi:hypothetical protein